MQVISGTVVGGKVVLEGGALPEGTAVFVYAQEAQAAVVLPAVLQAELEQALDEADDEASLLPAEAVLDGLRRYG